MNFINHPSLNQPSKTRSRVLIIYTGGTIGMVENPETGAHEPLNFDHLASHVPELSQLKVDVETLSFDPPLDSSNANPEHWSHLAHIIADHYDLFDGFVVLHGTDTMSFTASALSYMLENLQKAVVLTGSQLPIGVLRTDGKENLITAIEIAAAHDKIGLSMVPEVCIYFQGILVRGNRSKKLNAEKFNAFSSPNYPNLAEIGVHINIAHHHILPHSEEPFRPHFEMNANVVCLKLFPGITPQTMHAVLNIPGLRGVVLETYGTGNAPTDEWFLKALKDAVSRGIVIVNTTQCYGGAVEMGRYDTGNQLAHVGVIGAGDMTTEASITKLMFLLGEGLSQKEVEEKMQVSIAGEMNQLMLQWKEN